MIVQLRFVHTTLFLYNITITANPSTTLARRTLVTSTLLEGNKTCSGQMVVFTCMIRGSSGLAWSSDQYIGSGGKELLFDSSEYQEVKHSREHPDTNATLTGVYMEDGAQMLISKLIIIASPSSSNPLVTCRHTDDDERATILFHVYDKQ